MNNNTISNQKVEVSKGMNLNDKDYLSCLLTTLKEMSKNYVSAMTEASNQVLYEEYYDSFVEISNLQRKAYEIMFRKGWYQLEMEEETKIENKLQTLSQELNDLNS